MTAPSVVLDLVKRFRAHLDEYTSSTYKEAQVRQEFVNPLFQALGWDIANTKGYSESYKEVVHEYALQRHGGATEAPDYCFRVGGTRKFFVEAKKPARNVKTDADSALQLRRYAWTAKLPLSVLTDFEEFAVYDCRVKPHPRDKASVARIALYTYEEYLDRWDEISGVFAPEAILQGAFDKYGDSSKRRGATPVDDAFLQELELWRTLLARDIAKRNEVSETELNWCVQATIDRIVFLRICEDRGMEPYGVLFDLTKKPRVYPSLTDHFLRADGRYNSGLFHFKEEPGRKSPDTLTPKLHLADKCLKQILTSIYPPRSQYEFSVLPADILGQVYEQFLGRVIRQARNRRVSVVDRPEVLKAGGVYYTPTYVVDFIVHRILEPLLAGRTPKEVNRVKVIDPACGSGSFLLAAYQHLLDWHRDYYVSDGPERRPRAIYKNLRGEWALTIGEKKRVLLNNIFGVDIDPQAVEVSKLSLLLKVLEGENERTLTAQRELWPERALPDLSNNIKCGNSLVRPDFHARQTKNASDSNYTIKINAFEWAAEFPDVLKRGGFDVVIGNPPYGADYDNLQKSYFQDTYCYKKGKPETYIFFMELGLRLLRKGGRLGFIVPNAWLTNHYGRQIREAILRDCQVEHIADMEPTRVFKKAVVDTVIALFKKVTPADSTSIHIWQGTKDHRIISRFTSNQRNWTEDEALIFNIQSDPSEVELLAKLSSLPARLESVIDYSQGVIPYKTRADGQANRYISSTRRGKGWLALLESASQVTPFHVNSPEAFIKYGPWLWCARERKYFSEPKILFHRLRKKLPRQLVGAYDASGAVNRHSLSNLILRDGRNPEELFAILGLFNSKLANWWFAKRYGVLMEVGGFKIGQLPLPSAWNRQWGVIEELAKNRTRLQQEVTACKTEHETRTFERRAADVEKQIDEKIYGLYSMTPDEVQVVEKLSY